MRFDTINAASYLVWRLQNTGVVTHVRDDGDLILLHLHDGSPVMIYMVERAMTPQDLRYHFSQNTQQGIATLMIFWVDMLLPRDNTSFMLTDWMSAMLSVQGDKMYGFEVAGREAYFFPVHFTGQGYTRQIRYGDRINYGALSARVVATDHPFLRGNWRVADFAGVQPPPDRYTYDQNAESRRPEIAIYFEALGLHHTATVDAVKRAYHTLARRYHPDLNSSHEAHQRMKQINEAYTSILRHFDELI